MVAARINDELVIVNLVTVSRFGDCQFGNSIESNHEFPKFENHSTVTNSSISRLAMRLSDFPVIWQCDCQIFQSFGNAIVRISSEQTSRG
jgi:hypothetical protein